MQSVSPVLTAAEVYAEQVIALDQPQYAPIVVMRFLYNDGSPGTMTRYRLSDADRAAIAAGADLLVSQPHHGMLMPLAFEFALDGQYPEAGK